MVVRINVSHGFRDEAVIAETSVGLLWAYGPTQASHTALVSLCQKVVDTERSCLLDLARSSWCVFARNQQSHRMGAVLWTAHALPSNLYLKSAERARLLHGFPPANDSFQWLAWRNDHRRRRR